MPEIQSNTLTFPRDIFGNRVEDTAANRLFWYGAAGELLETTDAGSANHDYVYFAGRRIARHDSTGAVYYLYDDANGSLRTMTDAGGNVQCWADYYPFGEAAGAGCAGDNYQFAGLYSDAAGEDGGDSAAHRRYSDTYYRWFSPDPAGKKAVNLASPQTWNLYAYVTDNPTSLNDPLGLIEHTPTGCTVNVYGVGLDCSGPGDGDISVLPLGFVNPFPAPFVPNDDGSLPFLIREQVLASTPDTSRLGCAAQYGEEHSLASFLGVNHSVLGNAVFGNTFSDLANLHLFAANGSGSVTQAGAAFALNGPTLGVPTGSTIPGLTSVTGTATEAGVGAFLNAVRGVGTEPIELGLGNTGKIATEILPVAPELVGQIAGGIGLAKFGIDLAIDAYAYIGPCSQ